MSSASGAEEQTVEGEDKPQPPAANEETEEDERQYLHDKEATDGESATMLSSGLMQEKSPADTSSLEAGGEVEEQASVDVPSPTSSDLEQVLLATWASRDKADITPLMSRLNKQNCDYQTQEAKWTPLMILSGLPTSIAPGTAIRHLVQLGANPALADQRGWTALHWAAFHGYPQAAQEVLHLVLDLIRVTKKKFLPPKRHQNNAQEVLGMLRDLLMITNKDGQTPLQVAQEYRHEDVTKVLQQASDALQEARANPESALQLESFEAVLLEAWGSGCVNALVQRLDRANCNYTTMVNKWTPLMILAGLDKTCDDQEPNPIKKAISMGADPYIKDKRGFNALHWAAFYGSAQAAQELAQYGKLVEASDKDGRTPLMIARQESNAHVVQVIEESMQIENNTLKSNLGVYCHTDCFASGRLGTLSSIPQDSKDSVLNILDAPTQKDKQQGETLVGLSGSPRRKLEGGSILTATSNTTTSAVPSTPEDTTGGEAKQEIEEPNKTSDEKEALAFDFGEIKNAPTLETQDTLPLLLSMPTHDEKDNDKVSLLPPKELHAVSKEDESSIGSGSTKELNNKREAERRCGIYIGVIGLLGVIAGASMLARGIRASNNAAHLMTHTDAPHAPSFQVAPASQVPMAYTAPNAEPSLPVPTSAPLSNSAPITRPPISPIPTEQPTGGPTILPMTLQYLLPDITIQAILRDPESPQARAYQWLLMDPSLGTYSVARTQQRYGLATLYYATDGDNWIYHFAEGGTFSNNFLGIYFSRFLSYSIHECEWMPLLTREDTCNQEEEYLAIYLPDMNLRGAIPPELPLLVPTLESLELPNNYVTGIIPTHVGGLPRLQSLDLSMNSQLTGWLPSELGACALLKNLVLHWNSMLEGTFPTELGMLQALEQLWVSGTAMTGTLPSEFGKMMQLRVLYLQQNLLHGSIPPELFQYPDGIELALPRAASRQTNATLSKSMVLEELRLDSNLLTGHFPTEITHASSLNILHLSDNPELAGEVGDTNGDNMLRFDSLSNLEELTLDNTLITGEIPGSMCDLRILEFTCSDKLCGCYCECEVNNPGIASPSVSPSEIIQPNFLKTYQPVASTMPHTSQPIPFIETSKGPTNEPFARKTFAPTLYAHPSSAQAMAMQWLQDDPAYETYHFFRAQQRFALAVLYYSTTIVDSWVNSSSWLSYGIHECDWYQDIGLLEELGLDSPCQVASDVEMYSMEEYREYIAVLLPNNGLQGTIPPELALLSELRVVDLHGNMLTGAIPLELSFGFSKIEKLNLGFNTLEGTMRTEIGLLSNLSSLHLWGNLLTGKIPSQIGQLKDALKSLALSSNRMEQEIPSQFGLLSNLQQLWLYRNGFHGTLPVELASCTALTTIDIGFNQLSGTIPTQIGQLSQLETLNLPDNRLVGGLASEIGLIGSSLRRLDLSGNMLQQNLPPELWLNLTSIRRINLANNAFSGPLNGIGWVGLPLRILDLSQNQVTGGIPSGFSRLTGLEELDLSFNTFVGRIPNAVGRLAALEKLRLNNNLSIRGTIPAHLGSIRGLRHLHLHETLLSGRVPSSLVLLSDIETLTVNGTLVSGQIPPRLCQIHNLEFTCSSTLCGCVDCSCPNLRNYFGRL